MEPVKVFLDTNIVLDYFTGRIGNDNAKTIVLSGLDPRIDLCISILTAMNVLYVSGKYTLSLRHFGIVQYPSNGLSAIR